MESLSRIVQAIGFFLGVILILASFFIISNVVRLNVFARKMKSKSSGWLEPLILSSGFPSWLKALSWAS